VIVAMLAVLKAGAAYVPVDPDFPPDRIAFMLTDAQTAIVLTTGALAGPLPGAIILDDPALQEVISGYPAGDVQDAERRGPLAPAHPAYVIYTSGSTGQPTGVVVAHRHAVNSLRAMIGQWEIGPADAVLQFASLAFDASVMDMFMPLLAGARVVLAPRETLHSPSRLAALFRDAGITFACLPPAVLDLLPVGRYPDLRILMAGGDKLPAELARRWIRPGLRLVNAYGPTEATVNATYAELDAATPMPPPIGWPARPNYRAYVLDPQLNPVPAGVTGELHIGGASVARGYLNRPELTRDRFIPDPFTPGERLYKTGDLARRRPDGSLVFAGRIDNQVKIRGLRIELGEIETALATHPAIAQAVVTVTGPPGGQQLAGYLRPTTGGTVSEQDVRAYLARTLPAWMIPAHLVTVEAFPLNSSGKVDHSALPEPVPRRPSAADVVPATLLELVLADSYATVLGADRVGATDSFFDLGGNSLQVMRLIGVLDAELEVDVGVAAVFLAPTPRQLAALLRDKHGLDDEDLGPASATTGWKSGDVVGA
jgi:amino acid adenylation domain-containing protein